MKLQPFPTISNPNPDPASQILKISGIQKPSFDAGSKLSQILDSNGASVERAAATLGVLLDSSEDGTRKQAAEIVLKAHGAFKEAERPTVPQVVITIVGNEPKPLLDFLVPNDDYAG